jgi:hypothetical protein
MAPGSPSNYGCRGRNRPFCGYLKLQGLVLDVALSIVYEESNDEWTVIIVLKRCLAEFYLN